MAVDAGAGSMAGLKMNPAVEGLKSGNPAQQKPLAAPNAQESAEFRLALDQIASQQQGINPQALKNVPGIGSAAAPVPTTSSTAAINARELKFSNHAVERMRSRGINFQPDEMNRIASAVSKAAAKGAKDTLVLSGENALIVSVKNNTVVTVMDRAAMKENVFTNIDSTVVI